MQPEGGSASEPQNQKGIRDVGGCSLGLALVQACMPCGLASFWGSAA